MNDCPLFRTPESIGEAPEGSCASGPAPTFAGSSVTVCGDRLRLTHSIASPVRIVTMGGSKVRSTVILISAAAAGVGVPTALLTSVARPRTVGGGPPGVGAGFAADAGGVGAGVSPRVVVATAGVAGDCDGAAHAHAAIASAAAKMLTRSISAHIRGTLHGQEAMTPAAACPYGEVACKISVGRNTPTAAAPLKSGRPLETTTEHARYPPERSCAGS
jgi:hypothetical protein